MGRIQSSVGLITGIPIQDTVNQLMALAGLPRDTLVNRQKSLQASQGAVTDLTALTLGVQFAIRRFQTADLFSVRSVASGNTDLLTATAAGGATPGQYQFTPVRLAQSSQVQSSGVASTSQPLGAGTLSFRFGGKVDGGGPLAELNGGAGVARGKIRITDRSGATATIDLRFVQTIDDVLAAINGADEIAVRATTAGDRLVLTDLTGESGNLRVQEVSGGTTAAGLGLAGINVAADSATGQEIVELFAGLDLARINDGNGLSLRAELPELEITFRDNSAPLSLDLNPTDETAPQTLGDLLDRLNAADPARLEARISADGQRIELSDLTDDLGGTFAVANSTGGTAAEELGLTATASGDTISGRRLLTGLKTTLLTSLRGGGGLAALGAIDLTDRSGASATVDLAGAETLDDVIDAINDAPLGITASYNSARNGLVLTDTTGQSASNLIVADGDANNAATKLGLAADVAENQVDSGSLGRQTVSRSTRLADYNGGRGVKLGSIKITDSTGLQQTLNLAALEPQTIGDVIDAINGLAIGVEASINATGDGILLTDTAGGGLKLKVSDAGSGRTAADLHLAGEATATTIDGTTTFSIAIDADDALTDLVAKINDLGVGVSAAIFSESSGSLRHHLTLTSAASGQAGDLLVDGSNSGLMFSVVVAGQDALLRIGGSLLSSATNQFADVAGGLSVSIAGESTTPVAVNVATSADAAANAIATFVDNYNKLRDKLKVYTAFDAQAGTKGTLFGTTEALRLDSELGRLLTSRFSGAGNVQSLAELGVSISDDGKLSFDKARFTARYNADPAAVTNFFTDETRGFVAKADALLERLVGRDNSLLVSRAEALSRQIEDYTSRIDRFNARLQRQRERLLLQFYNLELVVAKFRDSQTALANFVAIPPIGSNTET